MVLLRHDGIEESLSKFTNYTAHRYPTPTESQSRMTKSKRITEDRRRPSGEYQDQKRTQTQAPPLAETRVQEDIEGRKKTQNNKNQYHVSHHRVSQTLHWNVSSKTSKHRTTCPKNGKQGGGLKQKHQQKDSSHHSAPSIQGGLSMGIQLSLLYSQQTVEE